MNNVLYICLAIIFVAILLLFAFIIYHQMLLLNEVNKRLMLMTKESIERERLTQEEYAALLSNYQNSVNEQTTVQQEEALELIDDDEPFSPHDYNR